MRAVVLVKRLDEAKARLAVVLPRAERRELVLAMLRDVLAALEATPGLQRISIVTSDPFLEHAVDLKEHELLLQPSSSGIDEALALAVAKTKQKLMVVPADLPLARAEDFAAVIETQRAAVDLLTLVPSHDRQGTNCLAVSDASKLAFAFGPGSFAAHVGNAQRAGLQVEVLALPRLALDIDTPEDLEALRRAGTSGHTGALLDDLAMTKQNASS